MLPLFNQALSLINAITIACVFVELVAALPEKKMDHGGRQSEVHISGMEHDELDEDISGEVLEELAHNAASLQSSGATLPEFLLGVGPRDGAEFFAIEEQMDWSMARVFEEKAAWVARQPPIIQHLYRRFLAERRAARRLYDAKRAKLAVENLSRAARLADWEIQQLARNVSLTRREELTLINDVLARLDPQTLGELTQAMPVIGPLSGNRVPDLMKVEGELTSPFLYNTTEQNNTFDYLPLATSINPFLDPCNDFYKFVCDGYMKRNKVPSDKQELSQHVIIDGKIEHQLIAMLEEGGLAARGRRKSSGVSQTKVPQVDYNYMLYDLYSSCMDMEARNSVNGTPLLDRLAAAHQRLEGRNRSIWSPLLVYDTSFVVDNHLARQPFYSLVVEVDERDTTRHLFALEPTNLYLYGTSYYLLNEAGAHLDALRRYLARLITLLAEDDYRQMIFGAGPSNKELLDREVLRRVENFIKVETTMARIFEMKSAQLPPQHDEDSSPYLSFGEFQRRYTSSAVNWTTYLEALAPSKLLAKLGRPIAEVEVNIGNVFKIEALNAMITNMSEQEMSDYLEWMLILPLVDSLDERYLRARQDFLMEMGGTEAPPPLQETCRRVVANRLPRLLDRLYAQRHFDEGIREQVHEMFQHVANAFAKMVRDNEWMDEQTKRAATQKLRQMRFYVGYFPTIFNASDLSRYHSSLALRWNGGGGKDGAVASYVGLIETLSEWHFGNELLKVLEPVTFYARSFIADSAYYRFVNTLIAQAGNLHGPFFYRHFPPAMNYGGMATILGHEITHGFDTLGSLFDGHGQKRDWWSERSHRGFARRKECLVDQYGAVKIPLGVVGKQQWGIDAIYVDAMKTLGENIADNGGLRAAYYAFMELLRRFKKSPGIRQRHSAIAGLENYSQEQLFFINWAFTHCTRERAHHLFNKIQQDEHAPAQIRTNVPLMNMNEFAKAFRCSPTAPMNPRKKCQVW